MKHDPVTSMGLNCMRQYGEEATIIGSAAALENDDEYVILVAIIYHDFDCL